MSTCMIVRVYERTGACTHVFGCAHAHVMLMSSSLPTLPKVGTHGMFHDREYVSDAGKLEWRPFHHTLEDLYGAVAQYYDLSVVSFR